VLTLGGKNVRGDVAQNHLIIAVPIAVTDTVGTLIWATKQTEWVDVELGHLKAVDEFPRPFKPVVRVER
jgi:hypothetical protein